MISPELLTETVRSLLNRAVPKNFNAESVAAQLEAMEQSRSVTLSCYGYMLYALEHVGLAGIYHGRLSDPNVMEAYANEAKRLKDDFPALLVNAKKYAEKVFLVVQDSDLYMPRLEGMSFPYVLFVLFAALGDISMVEQYKTETKELLDRYPGSLDLLPENIKNATMEALYADPE